MMKRKEKNQEEREKTFHNPESSKFTLVTNGSEIHICFFVKKKKNRS